MARSALPPNERQAAWSGQDARIRTAKLVAAGELGEEGWPWPYLVFEYIPGISLGEVFEQVTLEDRLRAARELGETVRRIHALALEGSPVFPNTHQPYQRFLEQQRAGVEARHREWGSLPRAWSSRSTAFSPRPKRWSTTLARRT